MPYKKLKYTFVEAQLIRSLEPGLQEVQRTGILSSHLTDTLRQLQIPSSFRPPEFADIGYEEIQELKDPTICSLCYVAANFLISEQRNRVPRSTVALQVRAGCQLLHIGSAEVCSGLADLFIPIFAYLVDTNDGLTGERPCSIVLQNRGCNATTFEWTVDVPEGKTVPKKQICRPRSSSPESTFNVLHASDMHFEPLYTEGKTKKCNDQFCCRRDQLDGNVNDGTACGYWSEYENVDASESFRKASEFDFDYVYFTGDLISHRAWFTSIENNARDLRTIFRKMKTIFKDKPIFTVLGNHEPSPFDQFANTIAAQFNGHTHKDKFMVYHSSSNTSEAINVALNGASLMPDRANPSFKIINVDNSNFDVMDSQEWTFNLTEANLAGNATPKWYQLYSFRETYGIKSLAASEFSALRPKMVENHDLLDKYHIFRYRNSDIALQSGCDNACKKRYLCEIATSQVSDHTQCVKLQEKFDENV